MSNTFFITGYEILSVNLRHHRKLVMCFHKNLMRLSFGGTVVIGLCKPDESVFFKAQKDWDSSWMENPSNRDGLLLKQQISPPFAV